MPNELTADLKELLNKLAELAYLSTIFKKVQSHAEKSATRFLDHCREKANDKLFVAITCLGIPNLSPRPFPLKLPSEGISIMGTGSSPSSTNRPGNESQCLAMASELFEGFLRGVSWKVFQAKPPDCDYHRHVARPLDTQLPL